MARPLPVQLATPADELRELLKTAETQAANLPNSGPRALDLLLNLDRLAELWPQIEAAGADLRPEAGRWETVLAVVRQKAPVLVGELRSSGGLPGLRAVHHPDGQAAWWWHLAETTQRQTRRRWLMAAGVALAVLAVVSVALFALNRLFPVDPRLREALSRQSAGQQKLEREGDYAAAAVEFERVVELMPDEPENWLYLAVAREHLGESAAAQQAFAGQGADAGRTELPHHAGSGVSQDAGA